MYLFNGSFWPQTEPLTGREVCHRCWNQFHDTCGEMFTEYGVLKCAHYVEHYNSVAHLKHKPPFIKKCDCTFECDCVHLSESHYADIEREAIRQHRKERKVILKEQLEDEHNPLRAVNHDYEDKKKKKKAVA